MSDFRDKVRRVIDGKGETHIERKKHRTVFIAIVGVVLLFVMFVAMLCIGPTDILNPFEAISGLFSAIAKGGHDMSNTELIVYSSRFPRALAALGVGLGLSVAGSGYQAVIRNPLWIRTLWECPPEPVRSRSQ